MHKIFLIKLKRKFKDSTRKTKSKLLRALTLKTLNIFSKRSETRDLENLVAYLVQYMERVGLLTIMRKMFWKSGKTIFLRHTTQNLFQVLLMMIFIPGL